MTETTPGPMGSTAARLGAAASTESLCRNLGVTHGIGGRTVPSLDFLPETTVLDGAGVGTNPGHRSVDMVCTEECEAVDFTGVAQ